MSTKIKEKKKEKKQAGLGRAFAIRWDRSVKGLPPLAQYSNDTAKT